MGFIIIGRIQCHTQIALPERLHQAFRSLLFIAVAGCSCTTQAQSLTDLLGMAVNSEPVYLSAKANASASEARSRQAFGALFPQISLSANTNMNMRNYETRNENGRPPMPPEKDQFNSNSAQVSFSQPIWRMANYYGLRQADAALAQAQQQLNGTEADLFTKLVTAWLDVIAARDNVLFTQRQAAATLRQWEIFKRGVELGTSGVPQAEDAKAKYEQALSDAVTAETDRDVKVALLEQLTGNLQQFHAPYIREDAVLVDLRTQALNQWLDAIGTSNPNVLAAQSAFEAATAEIKKQQAGHQPTLDLVGNYSKNSQAVGGFPGQAGYNIRQHAIGVQLNIPLFTGGTQSAKVSEAVALQEKARTDIEAARRSAILSVKQGWAGWYAAYAKATAGRQVMEAAKAALAAAQAGSDNGLRSELDVLQAEQQLHAGMRDYYKGMYDQIASYIKLKAATGALTTNDVTSLDTLFVQMADVSASTRISLTRLSDGRYVIANGAPPSNAEGSGLKKSLQLAEDKNTPRSPANVPATSDQPHPRLKTSTALQQ